MNAKEQLLEYARKHHKYNINLSDEDLVGKMIVEGAVIERTPSSITVARISRQGNQIVINETTKTNTFETVEHKTVEIETVTTAEIARINL